MWQSPSFSESTLKCSNSLHLNALILHCCELCRAIHAMPGRLLHCNGKTYKDINCHMTQSKGEPNRKKKISKPNFVINLLEWDLYLIPLFLFLNMSKSLRPKFCSHWSWRQNTPLYLLERNGVYKHNMFYNCRHSRGQ